MKLGMCMGFDFTNYEKHPCEKLDKIFDIGYDFIEINLTQLAGLTNEQFETAIRWKKDKNASILAGNVLLPGSILVVGDCVDNAKIKEHLKLVFERASKLGMETIVFGSGKAKEVPEGFSKERAQEQLLDFLTLLAEFASAYNIEIVIEPLNTKECNIINSVSEALWYVNEINHPRIKVLADIYHIAEENQPLKLEKEEYEKLGHVHFCEPKGRSYANKISPVIEEFAKELLHCAYDQKISVEGRLNEFPKEAQDNFKVMKELFLV